ncbi:MAG: alkylhydroperoxidase [Rhizobiaceae bacterium]|nr:alkylhydroperoxidase [Rhizobiaceae bacterium]
MTARIDFYAAGPELARQWHALSNDVSGRLEHSLLELVKIRASQLNGCANCINMHTIDARQTGESEQRIYLLSAWQEAPCYSERERAALAWTDALTRISQAPIPAHIYDELARHFSAEEQVSLTMAINVINGWNRIAVGFQMWFEPKAAA